MFWRGISRWIVWCHSHRHPITTVASHARSYTHARTHAHTDTQSSSHTHTLSRPHAHTRTNAHSAHAAVQGAHNAVLEAPWHAEEEAPLTRPARKGPRRDLARVWHCQPKTHPKVRACVRVRAWTCAGVRVRVRAVSGNTSPKLIQIAYISISPLTKNPNHHELTPWPKTLITYIQSKTLITTNWPLDQKP